MLITELFDKYPNFINERPNIADLEVFYVNAKIRFDDKAGVDPEFKQRARDTVVKLQSGDEQCTKGWNLLCDLSREQFN